jgi:predicted TIM-barrel fold metal-dependent hydrolase
MIMPTKRKRKTKTSTRTGRVVKINGRDATFKYPDRKAIIERIKKHKLRFDLDYERGLYDMTPTEADVYDDAINDILTIIRKM